MKQVFCPDCETLLLDENLDSPTGAVDCDWCGAALKVENGIVTVLDHGPSYQPLVETEY